MSVVTLHHPAIDAHPERSLKSGSEKTHVRCIWVIPVSFTVLDVTKSIPHTVVVTKLSKMFVQHSIDFRTLSQSMPEV